MRLFIGVELDAPVRRAAEDVAIRVRERLHTLAPGLRAGWVAPANFHITLWFLGEVSEVRAEAIAAALRASAFPVAPFDLALDGCGAFPPSGAARVLWIGVRRGAAEMAALYAELGARLRPLGFEAERRGYSAHLTIARVKDPARGTGPAVRQTLAATPADCGITRVTAVTLFRSRLSPRGATYEPLLRVPLS